MAKTSKTEAEMARTSKSEEPQEAPAPPARRRTTLRSRRVPAAAPKKPAPTLPLLHRQGNVVTFPDGEVVILASQGAVWRAPGTVSVRGPAAPTPDRWTALGVSPAQAAAIRFVASWLGGPFDAVYTGATGPRWGFWRLPASAIARILSLLESRHGDVWRRRAEDLRLRGAVDGDRVTLSLAGQPDPTGARLARDPLAVAALASLGRTTEAQQLQIAAVARHALQPVVTALGARVADHAALVSGLVLVRQLGPAMASAWLGELGDRPIHHLATRLEAAERPQDADLLRWALSSPELMEQA